MNGYDNKQSGLKILPRIWHYILIKNTTVQTFKRYSCLLMFSLLGFEGNVIDLNCKHTPWASVEVQRRPTRGQSYGRSGTGSESGSSSTTFWTGLKSSDNLRSGRPASLSLLVPTLILTLRTRPSPSTGASTTSPRGQRGRGASSSFNNTTSPVFRFLLGFCHLKRCCWWRRYSRFHRAQNCWVRYWTLRHDFLRYMSSLVNSPGAGRMGPAFMCSRWFGVSGSSASGSDRSMGERGILSMAAASWEWGLWDYQ